MTGGERCFARGKSSGRHDPGCGATDAPAAGLVIREAPTLPTVREPVGSSEAGLCNAIRGAEGGEGDDRRERYSDQGVRLSTRSGFSHHRTAGGDMTWTTVVLAMGILGLVLSVIAIVAWLREPHEMD